jgi:hypothetical protein
MLIDKPPELGADVFVLCPCDEDPIDHALSAQACHDSLVDTHDSALPGRVVNPHGVASLEHAVCAT